MVVPHPSAHRETTGFARTSHARSILVLDDNYLKACGIHSALSREGHTVTIVARPEQAADELARQSFDLVIVDGDLGDSDWGPEGLSGTFIRNHLEGKSYGRLSSVAQHIPKELRGRFAFEDVHEVCAWLLDNPPARQIPEVRLPPLPT